MLSGIGLSKNSISKADISGFPPSVVYLSNLLTFDVTEHWSCFIFNEYTCMRGSFFVLDVEKFLVLKSIL